MKRYNLCQTSSRQKPAKKAAWQSFSLYIRLRDCLHTTKTKTHGLCFTCGGRYAFKELQAGHFVAGRGNSVLFDEQGVHIQCKHCNLFKGGEPLLYRRHLVELYGEEVVRALENKRWVPRTYTVNDYRLICAYYTNEYEKLEAL